MSRPLRVGAIAGAIICATVALFGSDELGDNPPEITVQPFFYQGRATPARLSFSFPLGFAVSHRLSQLRPEERRRAGEVNGDRLLVLGVTRPTDFPTFGVRDSSGGKLERVADGYLWWCGVISPGAVALRATLTVRGMPAGTQMIAGNARNRVAEADPLADSLQSITPIVGGEEILIGILIPTLPPDTASVEIKDVDHFWSLGSKLPVGIDATWCLLDFSCIDYSTIPKIENLSKAVGVIVFRKAGVATLCSGALLNNTKGDGTPLFLTANHCIDTSEDASTAVVVWGYRTPACGIPPPSIDSLPQSRGATLLATNPNSDFTLLRLAQPPPAGSIYLGWSTTDYSNQIGMDLYRASHPNGWSLSYAREQVAVAPIPGCKPVGPFIYGRNARGGTDEGSSGSPLVTSDAIVVGQLLGACGPNPTDACNLLNYELDGSFRTTYPSISTWVDPPTCSAPVITAQPVSQTIQAGQSVNISVAAIGSSPLSYQWYAGTRGDVSRPYPGVTSPSIVWSPNVTASAWVRVSNSCGSVDSVTVTVTVTVAVQCMSPWITVQPKDQTIQRGKAVTLSVTATGTPPLTYTWYDSVDPLAPTVGGASYVTAPLLETHIYYVVVSNACGSVTSAKATATVLSVERRRPSRH